jgi:hypothetical protein
MKFEDGENENVLSSGLRALVEVLPADDPYRIHLTSHVDIVRCIVKTAELDPACRFCRIYLDKEGA